MTAPETPPGRVLGRGAFLGLLAAGLGGVVVGDDLVRALSRGAPSLAGVVPGSGWRIYTVAPEMPDIPAALHRVRVTGMVSRPAVLSLSDLARIDDRRIVRDFHCVTGWSVDGVRWRGASVAAVLEHVGADPAARAVRFVSAERPYEDTLTVAQARLDDVILAFEMDGAPLRREHGGPLRLVMPRMYGYKSVKWVEGIVLEDRPRPGYWEQNGYDADAWLDGADAA